MALVLYSTEGSHLCEDAMSLYFALGNPNALSIVDMAFDGVLLSRYAVTIPVISFQHENGLVIDSIGWPFDSNELKQWLVKHGLN